jgi:hypothetical protein
MSFIVETGAGLSDASSYGSVEDALDYIEIKGVTLSTKWLALDSTAQENYLMWATRLLDQRAYFSGSKTSATSGLRWPRQGVYDRDGIALVYDKVPKVIRQVTFEVANHLATQGLDPSAQPASLGAGNIKRLKADVVEIEYSTKTVPNEAAMYFPFGINQMLQPLGSLQLGTGARFGRVKRA